MSRSGTGTLTLEAEGNHITMTWRFGGKTEIKVFEFATEEEAQTTLKDALKTGLGLAGAP